MLIAIAHVATIVSAQEASPAPNQTEREQLAGLAGQLLQNTDAVDCRKHHCSILVTNFAFSEGYTSQLGIRLADELSAELARQAKAIKIIDRSLLKEPLQDFLAKRVPGTVRYSAPVLRFLGTQLNASTVAVGRIEKEGDRLGLLVHLLSVKDVTLEGREYELSLPVAAQEDMSPTDSLPALDPLPETVGGEHIYRSGVNKVGPPKCTYVPNPPYTDLARKFRISGTILIEALIDSSGKIKLVRIVNGLPYELNYVCLKTIATWKCNPATLDGKPVSTYVPIEITFRLY